MNEILKYLLNTVTAVIGCALFFHFCNKPNESTHTVEKTIVQVYDSTPKIITPTVAPSIKTFCLIPIPQDVDTAAILQAYFTVNTHYQMFEDSNQRAQIFDTISQNKIIGRGFKYQLLRPVKTIESTTVTLSPKGFYAGAFIDAGKGSFGIGPQASYLTGSNYLFTAGFDLVNKQILFGTQIKLHARGKR